MRLPAHVLAGAARGVRPRRNFPPCGTRHRPKQCQGMRRVVAIALAVALVLGSGVLVWAGGMTVELVDGRIRARFDQVPLREAVAAVARASGTELAGSVDMSPAVTLNVERVTVEEAFERLLAPGSFFF